MSEGPSTPDYGESFADVYDDWYATITDAEATADRVSQVVAASGGTRVLELGVGSGRLALPIAARGCEVVGIDSSPAMLDQLAANDHSGAIEVHQGDMAEADRLVDGPFAAVLIAFNTLFNVVDPERQVRCLQACANLVAPDGSVFIEAAGFTAAADPAGTDQTSGGSAGGIERGLSTSRVELDRVVLAATEHDPATQVITGQHIDISSAGIRLRPWQIRYLSPTQLDEAADRVGLTLVERHADWVGTPWSPASAMHVSRYQLKGDRPVP